MCRRCRCEISDPRRASLKYSDTLALNGEDDKRLFFEESHLASGLGKMQNLKCNNPKAKARRRRRNKALTLSARIR